MRRLLRRFSWIPVVLILGAFIWFAIGLSDPPEEAERENLVTGSIHAADPLKPDGPFTPYIALHKGTPDPEAIPEFPLDDRFEARRQNEAWRRWIASGRARSRSTAPRRPRRER